MSEQMETNYCDGDVVWVKLGSCWWPGEVRSVDNLPPDLQQSIRKPPLVVVKFFQEDTYEFVKNINFIDKYNCSRKNEFIIKGLNMYRAKHGPMEKFPEDIIRAETAVGGDIEILTRDEFQEVKKKSYTGIFGTPKKPNSSKRGRGRGRPADSHKNRISPKKVIEKSNYKVHILLQGSKSIMKTDNAAIPTSSTSWAIPNALDNKTKGCSSKESHNGEEVCTEDNTEENPNTVENPDAEKNLLLEKNPDTENYPDAEGKTDAEENPVVEENHDAEENPDRYEILDAQENPNVEKKTHHEESFNLSTPATPSASTATGSGVYACHACSFTTTRLNVLILHTKTHSASYVPYTMTPNQNKPVAKESKSPSKSSGTPKSSKQPIEKSEKSKKPKGSKRKSDEKGKFRTSKKVKSNEGIKSSLLADWDDGADDESDDDTSSLPVSCSPKVPIAAESPAVPTPAGLPTTRTPRDTSKADIKFHNLPLVDKPESWKYEFCEDEVWPEETDIGRKIPRVKKPKRSDDNKSLSIDEDDVAKEVAELLNTTAVPEMPSGPVTLKVEKNFHEGSDVKSPDKKHEKVSKIAINKHASTSSSDARPTKTIFKTKTFFRSRHSRSQDAIGKYVAEQLNAVERMDTVDSDINGSEVVSSPEARESSPIDPIKIARLAPKIQLKKLKAEQQQNEKMSINHNVDFTDFSVDVTIAKMTKSEIEACEDNDNSNASKLSDLSEDVFYPRQESKTLNTGVTVETINNESCIVSEDLSKNVIEYNPTTDNIDNEVLLKADENEPFKQDTNLNILSPELLVADKQSKEGLLDEKLNNQLSNSNTQPLEIAETEKQSMESLLDEKSKMQLSNSDIFPSEISTTDIQSIEALSDEKSKMTFLSEISETEKQSMKTLLHENSKNSNSDILPQEIAETEKQSTETLLDEKLEILCNSDINQSELAEMERKSTESLLHEKVEIERSNSEIISSEPAETDKQSIEALLDEKSKIVISNSKILSSELAETEKQSMEAILDEKTKMGLYISESTASAVDALLSVSREADRVPKVISNDLPEVLFEDEVKDELIGLTQEIKCQNNSIHENKYVKTDNTDTDLVNPENHSTANFKSYDSVPEICIESVSVEEIQCSFSQSMPQTNVEPLVPIKDKIDNNTPEVLVDNTIQDVEITTVSKDEMKHLFQDESKYTFEHILESAPSESDLQIAEALINLPSTAIKNKALNDAMDHKLGPFFLDNVKNELIAETVIDDTNSFQKDEDDEITLENPENPALALNTEEVSSRFETEEEKSENLNAAQSLVQMSESLEHKICIPESHESIDIKTSVNMFLPNVTENNSIDSIVVVPTVQSPTNPSSDNKNDCPNTLGFFDSSSSKLLKILEEPCKPRVCMKKLPTKNISIQGKEKILNFDVAKSSPRSKAPPPNHKIIIRRSPAACKSFKINNIPGPEKIVLSQNTNQSPEGPSVQTFTIQTSPESQPDADTNNLQQKVKKLKPTPLKLQKLKTQNTVVGNEVKNKCASEAQPTDDMVFDINTMPFVISDDILTPESIEKMPVVMSDGNIINQPPTMKKLVKTKQIPMEVDKVVSSSTRKYDFETMMMKQGGEITKSAPPNILSKSYKAARAKQLHVDKSTGKMTLILNKQLPVTEVRKTGPPVEIRKTGPSSIEVMHKAPPAKQLVQLRPPVKEVIQIRPPMKPLTQLRPSVKEVTQLRPTLKEMTLIRPPVKSLTQIRPPLKEMTPIRPPVKGVTQIRPPVKELTQIRPLVTEVIPLRFAVKETQMTQARSPVIELARARYIFQKNDKLIIFPTTSSPRRTSSTNIVINPLTLKALANMPKSNTLTDYKAITVKFGPNSDPNSPGRLMVITTPDGTQTKVALTPQYEKYLFATKPEEKYKRLGNFVQLLLVNPNLVPDTMTMKCPGDKTVTFPILRDPTPPPQAAPAPATPTPTPIITKHKNISSVLTSKGQLIVGGRVANIAPIPGLHPVTKSAGGAENPVPIIHKTSSDPLIFVQQTTGAVMQLTPAQFQHLQKTGQIVQKAGTSSQEKEKVKITIESNAKPRARKSTVESPLITKKIKQISGRPSGIPTTVILSPWNCPTITTITAATAAAATPSANVTARTATVTARTATVAAPIATVAARTATVAARTATIAARTATVAAPTATVVAPTTAVIAPTATVATSSATVAAPVATVAAFTVHTDVLAAAPSSSNTVASSTKFKQFDNIEEILPSTAIVRHKEAFAQSEPSLVPIAPARPSISVTGTVATLAPPSPPSDPGQLLAVPGEYFGGPVGAFYLCLEENGNYTPVDNRPLVLSNNQLVPMSAEPSPSPVQPERRDILEAALANSDVFHAEVARDDALDFRDLNANVSVHCRVSETSSTLNQPIMTPVEVPSKGEPEPAVHSTLEDGLAVIGVTVHTVPTSLELPITVTDPRIAPKTTDPLSGNNYGALLPSPNAEVTFGARTEIALGGAISMPLLSDGCGLPVGKSMPILTEECAGAIAAGDVERESVTSSLELSAAAAASTKPEPVAWSCRVATPTSDSPEEMPSQPALHIS